MSSVEELQNQLVAKDKEIERLNALLHDLQPISIERRAEFTPPRGNQMADGLDKGEIQRYSRQLLLPGLGVRGQLALRNTSVLVVGCGGLGSPVALYLAGTGIGRLGLLDHDVVELSNLHRQIVHSEQGAEDQKPKSESAAESCRRLNSNVQCDVHNLLLSAANALDVVSRYRIVVDATDNVATRYLLNDACVLAGRPLVSAGVLRYEGQLTVYHHNGSPCYRCIYPTPPPPETVSNCSKAGVLGPVVGVIGSMQAVEVVKLATGLGTSAAGRMLLYDGLDCSVRCVKLRPRNKDCSVCGDSPSVTSLVDYERFCGSSATDKDRRLNILTLSERISASEYSAIIQHEEPHLLVDVRTPIELEITKLPTTTHNVPMDEFDKAEGCALLLDALLAEIRSQKTSLPVYVVCRRGNDSQIAVQKLKNYFVNSQIQIKDIAGGLYAWEKTVDPDFPIY